MILVWLLAMTVWERRLAAFFTAAIFAVHPVNVEAVTNIAGRADLMAGMGVLAGLGGSVDAGESEPVGRLDVLARFLLDPFRQSRWGFSAGGGVSLIGTIG